MGLVTAEYLVGSNESVHSQVVLHHFACHLWLGGQRSALEQSRGCLSPASPDGVEAWMLWKNDPQD